MDFKKEIAQILNNELSDMQIQELEDWIEIPPNTEMGDYAFPCFRLAKTFRKSPNDIAKELAEKISSDEVIDKAVALGGYVNFFIDRKIWAQKIVQRVLAQKEDFGRSTLGEGKTALIEFSSPNIAKPFHFGHIRTTLIGQSLYRIYGFWDLILWRSTIWETMERSSES